MHSHPQTSAEFSKPFLKWTGGKQRLLSELLPHFPKASRLIEPFVGAGSVFLNTDYAEYVLNDANPDLMQVWKEVKANPARFCLAAEQFFSEQYRSQDEFERLRDRFNAEKHPFGRAMLFPYLNRFSFNGIYRVNSKGQFNVPYGHPARLPSFPTRHILAASRRLASATLTCGDFEAVFERVRAGDLVYCDPPYCDITEARSFVGYTSGRFDLSAHKRLVNAATQAVQRGATVMISNHDTQETRRLYEGWEMYQFGVRRSVSAKASSRGTANELLAVLAPC